MSTEIIKFAVNQFNQLHLAIGPNGKDHEALVLVRHKTFSVMCSVGCGTDLVPLACKLDNKYSMVYNLINDKRDYVATKETHCDNRVQDEMREYNIHIRLSNQLVNW